MKDAPANFDTENAKKQKQPCFIVAFTESADPMYCTADFSGRAATYKKYISDLRVESNEVDLDDPFVKLSRLTFTLIDKDGSVLSLLNSNKILDNMSEDALERLIWRGYEPLINDVNNNSENYSSKIINTLRKIEDYRKEERENILRFKDDTNEDLNGKFDNFRLKVNYQLDKMYKEFKEMLSKRKGIFS